MASLFKSDTREKESPSPDDELAIDIVSSLSSELDPDSSSESYSSDSESD